MHHRDAEGQTVGELQASQTLRPARRDLDVLEFFQREEIAGGNHLGEDHGDDLQILDVVLGVDPAGAVLHHQHPDRPPAAEKGYPEKCVERILPRLRTVRKGRVAGRVGQVQRPALAHDLADQPFARRHLGDVDGVRVEALGGEQLHLAGGAAQIDRAHLGHHGGRDGADHGAQLGLGRSAAGHGLANLPEQTARAARGERDGGHGGGRRAPLYVWALLAGLRPRARRPNVVRAGSRSRLRRVGASL